MRRLPLVCLLPALLAGCRTDPVATPLPAERLSAVAVLSGGAALAGGDASGSDTAGYSAALEPRAFNFPADHGPHPDFKTEWWYFTGHLDGADSRHYGYQLTFFRQALAPPDTSERASAWATRQLYMAHFTLSDVEGERFRSFERLSRGAADLAGAGGDRAFRVWLEDWSVESIGETDFPVRLRARAEDLVLDLRLDNQKPTVFHGDGGLSRKGAAAGQASFYYSLTRLAASGQLTLGGETIEVSGQSWLDREWSTSVLAENQVGWDWFSLQLDDGRELMAFQMRLEDGGVDSRSHGTLVRADGSTRPLELEDYRLEVLATWRSPRGTIYPAHWRLQVPSESVDLVLEPLLADQELDVSFRYWEGAIEITGSANGHPVGGLGYAELVGYD